jgi:hypothetical protein
VQKYCKFGGATDDNIILHMCIACWILKATNTHSECITLTAFEQQNCLHERFSILLYVRMYTACLVLRHTVGILTYCRWVLILTQYYRIFLRTSIIALLAIIIPPLQVLNIYYRCHRNQEETYVEPVYPLRTVHPIYRTGVPLPSRCCILYIFFNKYKY